jgi:hypothetical protein
MKSFIVVGDSYHVYSSSPFPFAQVQGAGYFESKVETDVATLEFETSTAALVLEMNAAILELETDVAALDLDTEIDMPQEISKQERYSANLEWSMLRLLLMGQL